MIRPAPAPRCPSADALSSQASVRECLRVAERRRVAIRGMSVLSVPKVCCLPKQAGTLTRAAFLVHRLHFAGFTMRWDQDHESSDLIDERGQGGGRMAGGSMLGLLPLLLRFRYGWVIIVLALGYGAVRGLMGGSTQGVAD